MKKVTLISDTHGLLGEDVLLHCLDADEIWHAGDIGNAVLIDRLESFGKLRAVYGNIDDSEIRFDLPEDLFFDCEGMKVFMTHIGGYPPRYSARVRNVLDEQKPDLYVCGHSHILKVIYDDKLSVLHLNPGACGVKGLHHIRTLLKFELHQGKISKLRVVELGLRGQYGKTIDG